MDTVRVAHEHLRAGRCEAALAALGDAVDAEATSIEVTTRALAFAGLGQHERALGALEGALAVGAELDLDGAALLEALGPALEGKGRLGRPRAARLLARIPPRPELPLEQLRADPDPLVRLAFVLERTGFVGDPTPVSRVFGSHGGDFQFGHFIAFDAPVDLRLRTFEPGLFAKVSTALSTLAEDPYVVETLELGAAFGAEVFGLGGNDHPIDGGILERAIASLNALDLLPWTLRDCGVRPYDQMEEEGRMIRRLARDLGAHPSGRQKPFDPASPLLERILAKHPLKGPPCPRDELEPLLVEARRDFTRFGVEACEEFARRVRGQLKL